MMKSFKMILVVSILIWGNSGFSKTIEFYYNVPPNDNPQNRGQRSNLIKEIDSAQKSLWGAFYQISDPIVVDAFIRAKNRGVEVVLITDADWYDPKEHDVTPYVPERKKLEDAKITLIPDEGFGGLMHSKYCIIDYGTKNARVWMGSTNVTPQCLLENGNLAFLFKDPEVAEIYYQDFKQMWEKKFQKKKSGVFQVENQLQVIGDKEGTPGGLEFKDFEGLTGSISYPKKKIEGTSVEFYFAPLHNIQKQVVEALYSAEKSIDFATYTLDNAMIYQTIMNKALTPETKDNPYNLFPVAIREEPWENIKEGILRTATQDGSITDSVIPGDQWKEFLRQYGGKENEGKLYNAAAYFYPPDELGGKIKKVSVHGVFNRLGSSKGPYMTMLNLGIPVRMAAFRGMLHHKFIIIDKKILILGSYNFSSSAEKDNDESAIIIRDQKIVQQVYDDVFVNMYKNAYPEYLPQKEEIEQFSYEPKPIAISEILFDSKYGVNGRYVEIYNTATCSRDKECDEKTVDLTGWKLWNGNIPWHTNSNLSGSTDDLFSYYNDPLENRYELNHPEQAYFLKPELQTLRPGEYGLIVGRDFKLEYLDEFLPKYEEQFQKIYGRKPQASHEKYPKLFVSSDPSDAVVGNGLKAYNFITLFYPDKFTMVDRFDLNASFSDLNSGVVAEVFDVLTGGGNFKLKLKRGQSLERIQVNINSGHFKAYEEDYLKNEYALYWYGLSQYSKPSDWELDKNEASTPGLPY